MNESTKKKSPSEAIDQVGTAVPRIIETLATALLSEDPIHFSKLDIKYGLCIIVCAVGEEWNFVYVITNHPEAPTELVIPSALQMVGTMEIAALLFPCAIINST